MSLEPTKKETPWLLPDCSSQHMPAGLYLVATPIGNLGDITVRALDMLSRADYIVCEDSRVTKKLLSAYGVKGVLGRYHDHSGEDDRADICERIEQGQRVVMVSDAGMPLVSDPGYQLVRSCLEKGLRVSSAPGANAPLMALQLSGLPSHAFSFIGFLPNKMQARRRFLERWRDVPSSVIAFESAGRLVKTLGDIADVMGGEREVAVVREMTKLHEEMWRGSAGEMAAFYKAQGAPKGEIVIVIAPVDAEQSDDEASCRALLREAMAEHKMKDAVKMISVKTGVASAVLYEWALEIQNEC